jgi:pimeloyl-ACP methyl ester carboxylesterase
MQRLAALFFPGAGELPLVVRKTTNALKAALAHLTVKIVLFAVSFGGTLAIAYAVTR